MTPALDIVQNMKFTDPVFGPWFDLKVGGWKIGAFSKSRSGTWSGTIHVGGERRDIKIHGNTHRDKVKDRVRELYASLDPCELCGGSGRCGPPDAGMCCALCPEGRKAAAILAQLY